MLLAGVVLMGRGMEGSGVVGEVCWQGGSSGSGACGQEEEIMMEKLGSKKRLRRRNWRGRREQEGQADE